MPSDVSHLFPHTNIAYTSYVVLRVRSKHNRWLGGDVQSSVVLRLIRASF